MSNINPSAEAKTFTLDNGEQFTVSVGDILRHVSWDGATEQERYFNKHLYRVTGFSTLPKDGSEAVLIRQIFHPMREYMYTAQQLQTKVNTTKYPFAKQQYLLIQHDVQFESMNEIEILEAIPKDMIDYIRFQEDPTRSEHFKSYFKK
ncbi:MAG: hypothetical protein E7485_06700 [Ruminococcaceae bacterium]|nr:hypothetical protein [Oscillospiraceae bacterium]